VTADEVFAAHRPRLLGIAYAMLGGVADAEDVVQDAWLRWDAADRDLLRDAEAWLVTVTTRLAIDRLRAAQSARETYFGPWLPEPLLADAGDDPADIVAEAEQLSLALLTALERLNPVERAVLILRDVFDLGYGEVADAVGKTPAACRQVARRARERVGQPVRRRPVATEQEARVLTALAGAIADHDVARLTSLLAADAILWSDGGGVARAARVPIETGPKVARFLVGVARKAPPGVQVAFARVNGEAGFRLDFPGGEVAVLAIETDGELVSGVRMVVNPHKLGHLMRPAPAPGPPTG
jgi:RNA polymerase sigma-70 factor (ECF subfamily)